MPTMNESLATLAKGVLTKVRALEADHLTDDLDTLGELGEIDQDLQVILSLLGLVKTIPAGTIGCKPQSDDPVVAVIELTQEELNDLTKVCGHDGFGMVPEAAQEIVAAESGPLPVGQRVERRTYPGEKGRVIRIVSEAMREVQWDGGRGFETVETYELGPL